MTISLAVPDILVARAQSGDLEALEALYRGEGHLWGWIRQIATSKALMRIRHDRVRETEEFHEESAVGVGVVTGAGAAGRSPGAVPAQIDLERAFERLSETARAVVWLHDVEGYTHEEIAEQMGKTVS